MLHVVLTQIVPTRLGTMKNIAKPMALLVINGKDFVTIIVQPKKLKWMTGK
jgi:hypothetical protein